MAQIKRVVKSNHFHASNFFSNPMEKRGMLQIIGIPVQQWIVFFFKRYRKKRYDTINMYFCFASGRYFDESTTFVLNIF